ncbi:MAG TPA: KEOPS complex subunit Pcc1 [Methanocorpusculum sp.]|nr:KEOPS complex subunit Pcc1 [Methanocorpusculum sp.]HJJ89823.1 KEOPS complex subunit Pcc1 [Methanocorpusculum sp.]HJJ92487.1 KEOPS complex subunit Pcc1 [Methanocorpusculum sp.]
MHVTGTIVSVHTHPDHVALTLAPDSNGTMSVEVVEGHVMAKIDGYSLRTVIATVDDYLMNLSVSEQLC